MYSSIFNKRLCPPPDGQAGVRESDHKGNWGEAGALRQAVPSVKP